MLLERKPADLLELITFQRMLCMQTEELFFFFYCASVWGQRWLAFSPTCTTEVFPTATQQPPAYPILFQCCILLSYKTIEFPYLKGKIEEVLHTGLHVNAAK